MTKIKKITFSHPLVPKQEGFGGLASLNILAEGLEQMGVEAPIIDEKDELPAKTDCVCLSCICTDLTQEKQLVDFLHIPYILIPFYEDFRRFSPVCSAFYAYIKNALTYPDYQKRLQYLYEHPEIIYYIPFKPNEAPLVNFDVVKEAKVCIANSKAEVKTIKRDCPLAKVDVIYWTPGRLTEKTYPYTDRFIQWLGLQKRGYILQIGRLEPRKNQLATILATRHLDIPLVFISHSILPGYQDYANLCIDLILKERKGKTIVLTDSLPARSEGNLQVIPINSEKGLDQEMLISAYQNARLYLHPAFYELPGYVYLEAAKLGTPSIATSWSTLKDYFTDPSGTYTLDDRILYAKPYDVQSLEKKILQQIDKTFTPSDHPILQRKPIDVAKEFLQSIENSI